MKYIEQDDDATNSSPNRLFLLLFLLALLGLGLWSGLHRQGWPFAVINDYIAAQHGLLLISGFIGSALAFERIVILTIFNHGPRRKFASFLWRQLPVLSLLGSFLLLTPETARVGQWIITCASLGLFAAYLRILDLYPATFTLLMAIGSGGWVFGNLLWLGNLQVAALIPAWAMFAILTITSQRFELESIQQSRRFMLIEFAISDCLLIIGALLVPLNSNLAMRASGLGALTLGLWLVNYDTAREGLRMSGLSRFNALTALIGYGWLAFYGILALRFGFVAEVNIYDAIIHSLFIGFTGGLIMSHAPTVLPGLLSRRTTYHSYLLTLSVGLHLSLAVRVLGDITNLRTAQLWGGLLVALFGLAFLLALLYALLDSDQ